MKLITKALLVIPLALIGFFSLLITAYSPWFQFGIIVILSLGLFSLFYFGLIKRLEKLTNYFLASKNSSREYIAITGNDEIASIASHINQVLKDRQLTIQHLKQEITQLQIKNTCGATQNISSKEKTNTLNTSSDTHPLTTLPSRAVFNETLNKAIGRAKRHNKILAILIVDIDSFKTINHRLGKEKGDHIINIIAQRLANTLRTEDMVAHLEGDEFIILLNDINKPKFASIVAEKLLTVCAQPIKDFFLTVSIGISIYPTDGLTLEDLLKNADAALYQAKHAGGGRYQFYAHEIDKEAREFIKLESALKNAIANNELLLYYQPKLNIKTGTISGVEGLLRWAHPEYGILTPTQFLPIAEDTGLIMKISDWALREACKTNKYWQDEGYEHLTMGLNLSPRQFKHPDIAKTITQILVETDLNPKYLELEINEAIVMDNMQIAIERLENIKATGVQISIDHFGTGYTSISHLKKFPVSNIKIDYSFIKGIPNNPDDTAITNALIALAHNLGLEVVAEGVETEEQVHYLASQNCDMIQGYFLSHPLPAQKIALQFKKIMDRTIF